MVQKPLFTDRELLAQDGQEDISRRHGVSALVFRNGAARDPGQPGKLFLSKPELFPDLLHFGRSCGSHADTINETQRECQEHFVPMISKSDLKMIRRRRKALDLKQEEVAAWIGKGRSVYVKKERGDVPLSLEEYRIIVAKLNAMEGKTSSWPDGQSPPGPESGERDHSMDPKVQSWRVYQTMDLVRQIYESGSYDLILGMEGFLTRMSYDMKQDREQAELSKRMAGVEDAVRQIRDMIAGARQADFIQGGEEEPVPEAKKEK